MFHAFRGLTDLVRSVTLSVTGYYDVRVVTEDATFWGIFIISRLLPLLLTAALAVPAFALLKRRPVSARLHAIVSYLIVSSLLAGPLLDALQGAPAAVHLTCIWLVIPDAIRGIYPLFILFWFLRPRIRRQVALWQEPDGPAIIPAEDERSS